MKKSISPTRLRKNITWITIALILSIAMATTGANPTTPTVSVAPQSIDRQLGIDRIGSETFWINWTIEDAVNVSTWAASMYFDPDILEVKEMDVGDFAPISMIMPPDWDDESKWVEDAEKIMVGVKLIVNKTLGKIRLLGVALSEHTSGSGTLAMVKFMVKDYGVSNLCFVEGETALYAYLPEGKYVYPLLKNGTAKFTSTLTSIVTVDEVNYTVVTDSNSTISNFNFNSADNEISFNVTGTDGTNGYCNITIPKDLLTANATHPWQIFVNGTDITTSCVITENATHTLIYCTYSHSTQKVQIIGIPEFPSALILPLLMISTLIAAVLGKKALSRKPSGPVVAG